MRDELKKIKEAAVQALEEAASMDYLNEQRVRFLGKKGELTTILKGMGKLSDEERPLMGQLANEVRDEINNLLDTKMAELKLAAQQAKLASETIDVTLPGRALNHGSKHPVTMVIEEAKQIFMGLGFMASITLMGLFRELLGAGSIFGVKLWNFEIGFFSSSAGSVIPPLRPIT